jgi:hypothetical protein
MTPSGYGWTTGGQAFADADPIELRRGQQVRFVMRNATMMPHPCTSAPPGVGYRGVARLSRLTSRQPAPTRSHRP